MYTNIDCNIKKHNRIGINNDFSNLKLLSDYQRFLNGNLNA